MRKLPTLTYGRDMANWRDGSVLPEIWTVSLLKLLCGLAINSVSLIADAFHTLADVIYLSDCNHQFRVAQSLGIGNTFWSRQDGDHCHINYCCSSGSGWR